MRKEPIRITPDCSVTLHYSLSLADGSEVVSTFDDTPLSFTFGDGTMVEALEQSLLGLTCGTEEQIILLGDEVFGPRNDDNIQPIPRNEFPDNMGVTAGQIIAFSTPAGDEVAGQVLEIHEDQVLIDFNHPLSGRAIGFRVKILEIHPLRDS